MPFLDRTSGKLYYLWEPATNKLDAETIVLLHTNITDHTLFDSMIPFLNQEYHILRYDLRGFGLSELGDEEISTQLYIEDLKFLLDALDLKSVYLVGIGFGSIISFEFSALYPEAVSKMVLMTLPCFPEESLTTVRAHREEISHSGTKIPINNLIKKLTSLEPDQPEYTRMKQNMSNIPVTTYVQIMNLTLHAPTPAYLDQTSTPTLILAGDREIVFPQDLLIYHAAQSPNIHYTVVPNSSSFLMIDQPEITAKLTLEFLKAKPQRGRYQDDVSEFISEHVRSYTQQAYQQQLPSNQNGNELQVDLLYSFQVHINGQVVAKGWNQRYAKHILIYLLFHPSTTREELCEQLWPQLSLKVAKTNLRVYLSYLKKLLNPYSVSEPILIIDREHIHLHGQVSSDALTFISELKQISQHLSGEQKAERVQQLLNRLSTANFLTVVYDDWLLHLRGKIESELIQLIMWLAKWFVEQGENEAAIAHLTKSLNVIEHNEPIYDALIHLYRQLAMNEQMIYWQTEKEKVWGA